MTVVGSGGLTITKLAYSKKFQKDFKKLDPSVQERAETSLKKLFKQPFPAGIKFEKLKGFSNPDIYTIHVTGNFKISFEIRSNTAYLRRIAVHNTIDATP